MLAGLTFFLCPSLLLLLSHRKVSECKDRSHDTLFMSGHEQTFLQTENYRLISILLHITPTLSPNSSSSCTADCTVNSRVLRGPRVHHLSPPLWHSGASHTGRTAVSYLIWGENRDVDYRDLLGNMHTKRSRYSQHMHYI